MAPQGPGHAADRQHVSQLLRIAGTSSNPLQVELALHMLDFYERQGIYDPLSGRV